MRLKLIDILQTLLKHLEHDFEIHVPVIVNQSVSETGRLGKPLTQFYGNDPQFRYLAGHIRIIGGDVSASSSNEVSTDVKNSLNDQE